MCVVCACLFFSFVNVSRFKIVKQHSFLMRWPMRHSCDQGFNTNNAHYLMMSVYWRSNVHETDINGCQIMAFVAHTQAYAALLWPGLTPKHLRHYKNVPCHHRAGWRNTISWWAFETLHVILILACIMRKIQLNKSVRLFFRTDIIHVSIGYSASKGLEHLIQENQHCCQIYRVH